MGGPDCHRLAEKLTVCCGLPVMQVSLLHAGVGDASRRASGNARCVCPLMCHYPCTTNSSGRLKSKLSHAGSSEIADVCRAAAVAAVCASYASG